jgi:UDP-N-acetylglucosamine 1-carboxyvinyltransferase
MPARLEIDGGAPLRGSVRVSAAKNATLPALAASLLTEEPVRRTNVPDLVDVRTMVRLIETLGATVRRERGELAAQVARVTDDVAPYDLVSTNFDRGYERLETKLAALGARIERRA